MKTHVYFYVLIVFGFLSPNYFISNGFTRNIVNAQTIDVRKLILIDTNMYTILHSIIQSEKSNNIHYSDSTVFGVWVENSKKDDATLITITGTYSLSIIFQIRTVSGFFKCEGHYFILMTECSELFRESGNYQTFNIDSSVEVFDDDRWPFHYIKYYEGAFIPIEQ